jgi:hypothetical protein
VHDVLDSRAGSYPQRDFLLQPEKVMAGAGSQTAESYGVKAVSAIPVVGQILGPILSQVFGFINSAHAAAVKKEGATINQFFPLWINTVYGIMQQLQGGAITEADAIDAINKAGLQYYSNVKGIIKIDKPCTAHCSVSSGLANVVPTISGLLKNTPANGIPIDSFPQDARTITTTGILNTSPTNCNSGGCNAACALGCKYIEPTTTGLINVIKAGGGTWVISATPQNGAIAPTPAVTITYKKATVLDQIDREFLADLHLSSSITGGSNVTGNIELAAILGLAGIIGIGIMVSRRAA